MSNAAHSSKSTAERDLVGKTVGRFAIDAKLGSGGMGEVYRARDTKLRRIVALKRLAANLYTNQNSRERLWKEAVFASRLNDPHIAAIHDAFEEQHEIFIVMEYVEGQTLRDRMQQPIFLREFLPIAVQCVAGLEAAHRAGIQHRDVKPENILLTRNGHVKILDFGIARRLPGDTEGTTVDTLASGGMIGTVTYMAPEIIEQQPADSRADIFSLGVVFYEALTGQHPFRTSSFFEICNRILKHTPPPVSSLNVDVPQAFDAVISRMLAKRPADRYSTAADILADLEQLQKSLDITRELPPSPPQLARGFVSKKTWAGIAAIVLALSAASWFAYRRVQKPVLTEHASILIADFENHTSQPLLDQTATEAVRESLEQSRYFRVIPRSQIHEALQLMSKNNATRIDRSLGRELCLRENCSAVLAGSISNVGQKYEIAEYLIDPQKDTPVLVESASMNSVSDLYASIDALSRQFRKRAGESIAQISHDSQPLARVTTSSLEALQRYSRGLDLYASGNLNGFLPLGESAVQLDPNFAMAHLYLARAYDALGNEPRALEHLAAAERGLDHVTDRERDLILADGFEIQEDYDKAAEQFRLLTETYPDDIQGFSGLAATSIWTGRLEEAVPAERHALELSPHSAVDHLNLILDLDRLNRFDEALNAYADAKKNGVDTPLLHWGTGLADLGNDDAQQARTEFELLASQGGPSGEDLASFYLARVLMYQGRLGSAAKELRKGLVLDEKMNSQSYMPVRHYLLAQISLIQGDTPAAQAEGRQMASEALRAPQSEDLRRAGEILVRTGDLSTAQEVLRGLGKLRAQHDSQFMRSSYYNLDGALKLAQNRVAESVESQRKASIFFPLYNAYLGLGDALGEQHDWSGAAQAYNNYLNFKGEIFEDDSPATWVLAHLAMGRTLAHEGKDADALKYYNQFLQLWANADSDLPPLQEARSERRRLSTNGETAPAQASDVLQHR